MGSVTLKDLAAELGLSITTVSRALGGYSDVAEETVAKRIQGAEPDELAEEVGSHNEPRPAEKPEGESQS